MREAEFQEWLEARRWNGKPLSSISSRMSKARRFERAMPALGLGVVDLDAAFDEDGMEAVTAWLREACRSAAATGTAPAELVGTTANAGMRMANVASAVRNYRQFREAPPASDWPALDGLRAAFCDRVPEFDRFTRTDNSYERIERTFKDAMAAKVREIAGSDLEDEEAGRRIYRALIPRQGALLSWQVDDHFARRHSDQAPAFYAEVGRLARREGPIIDAILASAACFADLRQEGASSLTIGQVARIALTVAAMVRPHESAPFAIGKAQALAKLLLGDALFVGSTLERSDLDRWLGLLARIETVMREDWSWEPRDLIDVQGFAWVALDDKWVEEDELDDDALLARFAGNPLFDALRARWTAEQTVAFCTIARAVHDAGLDWYHTKHRRTPVRFGRKPEGATTAFAAQGYLVAGGEPRVTLNSKGFDLGIEAVPLDAAGADDFAERLAEQAAGIADWFAPKSLRAGRWPDEGAAEAIADDTPIWLVTARNGETDGLAHYVERGEWHLLEDRGSRMNDLVREMQPGDRIVLRDYVPYPTDLPFPLGNTRVTALRIRATGIVTEQRGDGLSVGVEWTVLPEPRTWYFYTNNDPVWWLKPDNELAQKLAAFIFDGEPQDYAWFAARWFKEAAVPSSETIMPDPTNLILYGPPGTGKTYATAREAVRLVDGAAEGNEAAIRIRYAELVAAGQVRFVTFHQSYAYEDFVEGLRPTTGEEGEGASAGFSLKPVPGVFRELSTVAEQAMVAAQAGGTPFDLGQRQVFKMSLGRAGAEDHIFDAAVEGEYVVLGWGGEIDWTPFDTYEAIHARWNEDHPGTSGNDGNISQLWRFRCSMAVGDLVVVSFGNTRFRAIGEIVGDYEYTPTGERDYNHRRRVRWLYVPEAPLPVGFYDKPFTMRSCYLLREEHLNREALALLLPGTGGEPTAPKQFVLICDEINRANISKVFGELITLLEPDKRIGAPHELRIALPYSKVTDFGVPRNLHVIGTMNTADRSIALIDKALRRRFKFVEMMPDYTATGMDRVIAGVTLARLLETLNERIEYLLDREHQIGHGWLIGCTTRDDLDARMRGRIIPLIAEYFFEDWGRTADVLGGRRDNPFLDQKTLSPPPGMAGEEPRNRWSVRADFSEDAFRRLVEGG